MTFTYGGYRCDGCGDLEPEDGTSFPQKWVEKAEATPNRGPFYMVLNHYCGACKLHSEKGC